VSSVAFAACCSEVGAGGETGSGEDGSDDCIMDMSDSPWERDPGGRTGAIKAKKSIPSKYRAFNQNSTQSCTQLPNKSSLTLTSESVLKRWVSWVWLKVELQQQGCSCTRIH